MVFSTIAENIKSFFQKEGELERQPQQAPDAAIEVFEKPLPKDGHAIVAHNLQRPQSLGRNMQSQPPTAPPRPPKLPFSSEQLKERLKDVPQGKVEPRKEFREEMFVAQPASTRSSFSPSSFSQQPVRQTESQEDIHAAIAAFEEAVKSVPGEDGSSFPLSAAEQRRADASSSLSATGYFSTLGNRLRDEGYEAYDRVLSDDEVTRMRQHHEERLARQRQMAEAAELDRSLGAKLARLSELEHEWASKREQIEVSKERMAELESAIGTATEEFRQLVGALKSRPKNEESHEYNERSKNEFSFPEEKKAPESFSSSTPSPHPESRQESLSSPLPPLPPHPVTGRSDPDSALPQSLHLQSQWFHLHDGRVIRSLAELARLLPLMDDATFYHHVTPERNDFSSWIAAVFGRNDLAIRLRSVQSKHAMARLLEQAI